MTSTARWHHALLPGALRENPDGRRSARDWLVDLLMLVIAVAVGMLILLDTWSHHGQAMALVDIALGVVALVALWWRRSHPAAVGVLTTAASVLSGLAGGPALIAGFNVALRGSRRAILAVVALTATSILVFPLIYYTDESYLLNVFIGTLLTAVVMGWGLLARVSREHVLTLQERAAQVEAEQSLRIEQARDAERRRIAGEMHDVLTHRVSLLSLHAGALEFRPDASPEEISEAAGVIRAAAHAALEELRQVIGVLRDGAPDGAPEPPQPTLADIPALVEEPGRGRARALPDRRPRCRAGAASARADRLPHRPGRSDERAQACAGGVGRCRGFERRAARRRGHQPASGGRRRRGRGAARCRQRADRTARARRAGRWRTAARPRPRGGLRPARDASVDAVSIRVLLVDDDPLVRSGLRMMLAGAAQIEVVGEAEDGRGVLAAVDLHRPDVVLMDIRMPQLDGVAATRLLRSQPDPPAVVVLTTFDADEYVMRALRAGAAGFLLKDTPPPEIVRAIELVHAGEGMLSPSITRRLIALATGHANADIAAELHMSVPTVKAHVSRLLSKLDADNRVQIALLVQDATR